MDPLESTLARNRSGLNLPDKALTYPNFPDKGEKKGSGTSLSESGESQRLLSDRKNSAERERDVEGMGQPSLPSKKN